MTSEVYLQSQAPASYVTIGTAQIVESMWVKTIYSTHKQQVSYQILLVLHSLHWHAARAIEA